MGKSKGMNRVGRPSNDSRKAEADAISKLPPLTANLKSIAKFTQAVAAALGRDEIQSNKADKLISCAKAQLSAVRTEHGLHEIDQLRKMLERAERVMADRKAAEMESRYGKTADLVTEFVVVDEPTAKGEN